MKTAISLPEQVARQVELHARKTGLSKDQLFAAAMTEYLARHPSNGSTENTSSPPSKKRSAPSRGVKSRFSKTQLRTMTRNHPPPKSWFQEPAADLTKPK